MTLTILTVLRSGGPVYDQSWVIALQRGIREHLSSQYDFACLTDLHDLNILGVRTIPLKNDWPGWWSKVEMFSPDNPFAGPVLYMDLDTLPIGPLDDLAAYTGPLATLSDFYQLKEMASGVLAFTPNKRTAGIYQKFAKNAKEIMRRHTGRSDHWYRKVMGRTARLQDLFPRQIVSLKVHAKHGAPGGSRLVAGHGRPRLKDRSAGWAHEVWKRRVR